MGAIHFSLDPALARLFRDELGIGVFVETGTFQGDTAFAMASEFGRVITIELGIELAERASERFSDQSEVRVFQGASPYVLEKLQPELSGLAVLYWLDAHWCSADSTAGFESQCPLLEELGAIGTLREDSAVLIDDARLFLTAPPAPHEISNWPTFDELLLRIREVAPAHEISVTNDVIIVAPAKLRSSLQAFAQEHGHDLLRLVSDARDKEELGRCHREAEAYAKSLKSVCDERQTVIDQLSVRIAELELALADGKANARPEKNAWLKSFLLRK